MGVRFILTGSPNEGKTTKLQQIVDELKSRQLNISGFLAPGIWENEEKAGFDLLNLDNNECRLLARTSLFEGAEQFGRFFFSKTTIAQAELIIYSTPENNPDLIIIDEIGKFELAGQIWHDSLFYLQQNSTAPVLIVVRNDLTKSVISFFKIIDPIIFNLNTDNNHILNSILSTVQHHSTQNKL